MSTSTDSPKTSRRPAIRFSLRATLIFYTSVTVFFGIISQVSPGLAVHLLIYAMVSIPAPLLIGIIHGRGKTQSFFVGTMLPAVLMAIVALAHLDYLWNAVRSHSLSKIESVLTHLGVVTILSIVFAFAFGMACSLTHTAVKKDDQITD